MKDIALVLCAFNNSTEVLQCIESVFKSSISHFDLFVVDNGSTDGCAQAVSEQYGQKVNLIVNTENNGAGAGFNTGIKAALQGGYHYVMLLDHDIIVEPNSIEHLYKTLQEENEIGIVGAKFCYKDRPDVIQWMGAKIDLENFKWNYEYRDYPDDGTLPKLYFCDGIILGGCMARVDAIKKIGLIEEDYFLYGEDLEWSFRFRRGGYKIAICSDAKVLHGHGASKRGKANTMGTYYYWRNLLTAYVCIVETEALPKLLKCRLKEVFKGIYSCYYQGKFNTMLALYATISDASDGQLGRAKENRILEKEPVINHLMQLVKDKEQIVIYGFANDNRGYNVRSIQEQVKKLNNKCEISIEIIAKDEIYTAQNKTLDSADLKIFACEHIYDLEYYEPGVLYVDVFFNMIKSEEDRKYCMSFKKAWDIFYRLQFPIMLEKFQRIHKEYQNKDWSIAFLT